MSEMERCTLEQNGFVGIYYPGHIHPEKAVIAAGGASCDEKRKKDVQLQIMRQNMAIWI